MLCVFAYSCIFKINGKKLCLCSRQFWLPFYQYIMHTYNTQRNKILTKLNFGKKN